MRLLYLVHEPAQGISSDTHGTWHWHLGTRLPRRSNLIRDGPGSLQLISLISPSLLSLIPDETHARRGNHTLSLLASIASVYGVHQQQLWRKTPRRNEYDCSNNESTRTHTRIFTQWEEQGGHVTGATKLRRNVMECGVDLMY